MKTKTRTFIALSALGMIGLLNINAIADNTKTVNSETGTVGIEILNSVVRLNEMTLIYSPETFTIRDIDAEIEKHVTKEPLPKENANVETNLLDSAITITVAESDEQIAKYANKLVALAQSRNKK